MQIVQVWDCTGGGVVRSKEADSCHSSGHVIDGLLHSQLKDLVRYHAQAGPHNQRCEDHRRAGNAGNYELVSSLREIYVPYWQNGEEVKELETQKIKQPQIH